jgi:hypothetical protein
MLCKTVENGVERLPLMEKRLLALALQDCASKPTGNGVEIVLRQPIKVVPSNVEKATAIIHHFRQIIAVGEEDPFADLIGEADERGQLLPPSFGRPVRNLD